MREVHPPAVYGPRLGMAPREIKYIGWEGVEISAAEVYNWLLKIANDDPVTEWARFPDSESYMTSTSSGNVMLVARYDHDGDQVIRVKICKVTDYAEMTE